jgi:type II secretory pathway pseudopilin PulG
MNRAMGSPRSESGFALIEAIVSAAVLAIVALAVLSGIDGANGASAREKSRAVAVSLAEQDQERVRAMAIDQAAAPTQQNPVTVDGVTYKIQTKAEWITDDVDGTPVCGADSNQVQYLHVTSTVSSATVGARIAPVTIDSLISPTAKVAESKGTLGVRVEDRVKTGVQGIGVTISSTGYTAPTDYTDKDGCVVFDAVPVGTYTITIDQPGYLGRDGLQLQQKTQNVAAKKVTFSTFTYDKATKAQVSVTTHRPNSVWNSAQAKPSKARTVAATNGAAASMLLKFTPAPTNPDSYVEATNLYPFAENSYQFFTGGCGYASPDTFKPANTNYFTSTNPDAALRSDPANTTQLVSVRQPPLNIRIKQGRTVNGTTAFNDGDIKVYLKLQKPDTSTDSCSEPVYELTTLPWPAADWGTEPQSGGHWVSQSGTFDPGMPFGTYKICLRQNNRSWLWSNGDVYDNTSVDGKRPGVTEIVPPSSSGSWSSSSSYTTCGL